MRSAVNDLQALALGRSQITLKDIESLGRRDTTGDMWGLLGKVFYGTSLDEARKSAWDLDETPEDIALWIDENLPVMYTNKADLVQGYAALSKASLFIARVQRRQQYGLWSYATELMTGGVAVAKRERPSGARFQFPSWLRKQSQFKGVRELRKKTATKVGAILHTSHRRAYQDIFPYLRPLMRGDEQFSAWVAWQFDLEADELAFLLETKPTTAEIKRILELSVRSYVVTARPTGPGAFGRFDTSENEDAGSPRPKGRRALGQTSEGEEEDEAPTAKPALDADDEDDETPVVKKKAVGKETTKKAAPVKAAAANPAAPAASPAKAEPKKQRSLGDF
jgi:replication factor C large subunit